MKTNTTAPAQELSERAVLSFTQSENLQKADKSKFENITENKAPVRKFTRDHQGRLKDEGGKEWIATYFETIMEEEIPFKNQTLLRARYYCDSERMSPALLNGDMMLLKKVDRIFNWGAIHLIQAGDYNIICRPNVGSKDKIILNYDSKNAHYNGQELPTKYIIAIWELVASNRIHQNIVTPIGF